MSPGFRGRSGGRSSHPRPNDRPTLAYVLHTHWQGVSPEELLERWPATSRLMEGLVEGGLDVATYWRSAGADQDISRAGVLHRFVADRSRLGWRLALAVRRGLPDVVHVNGLLFSLPTILLRLCVGRRVRMVVQHHGEPPGRGRSLLAMRLARRVVDGYLFTGAEVPAGFTGPEGPAGCHGVDGPAGQAEEWRRARVLASDTPTYEVLEASTDIIPISEDEARRSTGMVGDPAILWVGRLVPDKDPLTAVAAFAEMVAVSPGAEPGPHLWMLATDRDLEAEVLRAARARPELTGRVHVVGPVPHTEVGEWFSAAQIYFSTSTHEGSGYALIEALACGCTPVVSDIAPHRAIAARLGRRFPTGDVDAAASALAGVELLPRGGVRGEFKHRLSWESVVRQLRAAYGLDSGGAPGTR